LPPIAASVIATSVERDDRGPAIEARRDQLLADPLIGRQRLLRLARLDRDGLGAGVA
jgi:hypothetical protein